MLLFRSAVGELCVRAREGMDWGAVGSLGVPTARVEGSGKLAPVDWPIAACGTGDGEVHLLARGAEGELVHGRLRGRAGGSPPDRSSPGVAAPGGTALDGLGWSGFVSIGVPVPPDEVARFPQGLAGAPAACSRTRGQLDVFAVGGTGALLHTSWDGDAGGFSECEAVRGLALPGRGGQAAPLPGAVAACAAGSRMLGVLARGPSGSLLMTWWDGARWSPLGPVHPPEEIDPLDPALAHTSPLSGPPAICGGGSARADAFARGPRGDLLHIRWDGKRWGPFESMGMPGGGAGESIPFAGGPVACAWGRYRLDVFACAVDGQLYNASREG